MCILNAGHVMETCVEDPQPSKASSQQQPSLGESRQPVRANSPQAPVVQSHLQPSMLANHQQHFEKRKLIVDQLKRLSTVHSRFVTTCTARAAVDFLALACLQANQSCHAVTAPACKTMRPGCLCLLSSTWRMQSWFCQVVQSLCALQAGPSLVGM